MTSFLRVVRLSLRYRGTVVGAVLCAIMIGVLWGGNIGAVFPFVEVVFRGQSLQETVDREIDRADAQIQLLEQQLASAQQPGTAAAPGNKTAPGRGRAAVATRSRAFRAGGVRVGAALRAALAAARVRSRRWCWSSGC